MDFQVVELDKKPSTTFGTCGKNCFQNQEKLPPRQMLKNQNLPQKSITWSALIGEFIRSIVGLDMNAAKEFFQPI